MNYLLLVWGIFSFYSCISNIRSESFQKTFDKDQVLDSIILLDKDLGGAILSVNAFRPSSKTQVKFNSHYHLPTASIIKILTTLAGLEYLSDTFKFTTLLQYSGNIITNNLEGDIIIKGGGDPSFLINKNSQVFERWVNIIMAMGIKNIEGDIIVNTSVFENQALASTWLWEDIGNWYAGGSMGLNIYQNRYYITFAPTAKLGQKTKILFTIPPIEDIKFKNEVISNKPGTGDNAYIYGSTYSKIRFIRGTIPLSQKSFQIKGALPNPPLIAAKIFKNLLFKNNISIQGEIKVFKKGSKDVQENRKIQTLDSIFSKPLKDLIYTTNQYSNNLYAESIFKFLGYKLFGEGTNQNGSLALEKFLGEVLILKNTANQSFNIADGCGLSPYTTLSTDILVQLLYRALEKPYFHSFYKSLPVNGQSGTLKNTFLNPLLKGKVHAKSGTSKRLKSYAGYLYDKKGERICFAITVYNHGESKFQISKKIEKILLWLNNLGY